MAQDTLPEDINTELQKCMTYHIDLSRVILYALGDATQTDLTSACTAIQKAYNENIMRNRPGMDFIFPAPANNTQNPSLDPSLDPTDLVRYHVLDFDKGWKESSGNNQGDLDWYPFGFAVLTSRNWREDGIVLVHCQDHDDGVFWADSCILPVEEVGINMLSLVWGDEDFEGVKVAAQVFQSWRE